MLFVTTALSGLMAGMIQTAPAPRQPPTVTPDPAGPGAAAPAGEPYDLGAVVATGQRARGSVNTDIPPDVTLSAEQIQAYGASNIEELLTYLEPITRSSRGRADGQPVMLVNGRRTSGFQEIRGIPSEAIERIETFPEEVALQYGYRADQRVVNFVLKAAFRSVTLELQGRAPVQGGRTTTEVESNILRIAGSNRWSLDVEHETSTPLFESERDIVREPAGDPLAGDPGAYRTLLAESERSSVGGSMKRDLNGTTQATISASVEDRSSRSFNGLPGVTLNLPAGNPFSPFPDDVLVARSLDAPQSLGRTTDTLKAEVGAVADGFLGDDWRWTLTGQYTRTETDTVTGRGFDPAPFQTRLDADAADADPFGPLSPSVFARVADDTARSVAQRLDTELVLTGDVWEFPAGGVSSTFKLGADALSLDSASTRGGETTDRGQSRKRVSGQASFTLPIASRRLEVLPGLGDLTVNFNAGYEELSDFGGLPTVGVGVNWSPIEPLSLLVSYTGEQGAPSISQLNDPTISTPNTPVFDFATGETVLVTRIDGGNPGLNADNRQVWKAGATLRPFSETNLSISSTWTLSRTDDSIAAFPTLTPDLEAALPGRFTRDAGGNLIAFDARPLNFERFERQDVRTGFNFSRAFGKPDPAPADAPGGPGGPRPAGGGGGAVVIRQGGSGGPPPGGAVRMQVGGGGGRGGRGASMQPGQGMFNLSIYHTWRLQDEIVIAEGLPVLDLLDGAATGARGGSPRHEIQAQAGVFKSGMGAFMHVNWRDATRIDGGAGRPDLDFSDLATVNLNVFIDLGGQAGWVAKHPWLKGSRLNFGVQNLFDSRPEVTAGADDTPLNYQPDYLDPQGRVVSLTFRKILF